MNREKALVLLTQGCLAHGDDPDAAVDRAILAYMSLIDAGVELVGLQEPGEGAILTSDEQRAVVSGHSRSKAEK